MTVIICIDFQAVGHWATENSVPYSSYAELSQHPKVYDLIQEQIEKTNQLLPEPLQIRRFVNLHKEFDANDGEVTRTRKLRRKVIDQTYAAIIDAMYHGHDQIEFEAPIMYETGETGVLKRTLRIQNTSANKRN